MSPDLLFSICNMLVLPGWLLLFVAPRWRWTQRVSALLIPLLLSLLYLWLIATTFGKSGGGFGSLAAVQQLFQNPYVLVAGWVHYLAFDLFTGSWETRDAIKNHVPLAAVWPCLLLTFLFGPIGWLSYICMRATIRRKIDVD